jgi:phosphoglycerate kinase
VLESLLGKVDKLIVGGGIANTFLLAEGLWRRQVAGRGGDGRHRARLLKKSRSSRSRFRCLRRGRREGVRGERRGRRQIGRQRGRRRNDPRHRPDTAERFARMLHDAGTIVWNGPVGVFEFDQFGEGTRTLAQAIARSPAFSIAGGGDTLAAIEKYRVEDDISYISTAAAPSWNSSKARNCRPWQCSKSGRQS